MNLLIVSYKATNELDFMLPLLWKLREVYPDINISIFYGVLKKKMILRKASFYSELLKDLNIKEYDLSDFLFKKIAFLNRLITVLFRYSYWDGIQSHGFSSFFRRQLNRVIIRIDKFIASYLVDYARLFSFFDPKIIFFALRGYSSPIKNKFFDYTKRKTIPVIMYPQGAFPSTGSYEVDFGQNGKKLPTFVHVWYSFIKEETPQKYKHLSDNFFYVGYTGLDEKWFSFLRERCGRSKPTTQLSCLFIIRKFVKNNNDDWVYDYDEFYKMMQAVVIALKQFDGKIKLVIKPHPSNDYKQIEELMKFFDYKNYEIASESIYDSSLNCDFAISVSSTAMLVPALMGLPVILLNSSVKSTFERWKPMKELFSNLKFYVDSLTLLNEMVRNVVKDKVTTNQSVREDIDHFRKFFPDGSIDSCLNKLVTILNSDFNANANS